MSAAVDNWRCRLTGQLAKLSSVIESDDYLGAELFYIASGADTPYPWHKIHRKWRVFQHVPISPTKTAQKILGDSP